MTKELSKFDIIKTGRSRIGHQYGDSVKFKEFVTLTIEQLTDIQDAFFSLLDIDLDTAKGVRIDLIGRIVGAPAVIPSALPQPFFGFDEQPEALGFGELDDETVGGFWREVGQQSNIDYLLDYKAYKKAVHAKILANNSDCSPDDIINVVKLLTDDADVSYNEITMAIIIAPAEPLNYQTIRLIEEIAPIPAGVSFAVLNGKYDDFALDEYERHQIYFNDY